MDRFFVVLFVWIPIHIASAQSALTPKEVVARIVESREKLYAGDVVIRGIERRAFPNQPNPVRSTRQIFERQLFDLPRERLWHEQRKGALTTEADPDAPHEVRLFGAEGYYQCSVYAKHINVFRPALPVDFWDCRAFGICTFGDLNSFARFEEHVGNFEAAIAGSLAKVESTDADGIIVLVVDSPKSSQKPGDINRRTRYWVDTNQDFVVVRMEQQYKSQSSQKGTGDAVWMPPTTKSATEWTFVNHVWVPKSTNVSFRLNEEGNTVLSVQFELAFDWHAVNQVFDESNYSLAKLDVPEGSHYILDMQRDPANPLVVQHPNISNAEVLEKFAKASRDMQSSEPQLETRTPLHWILMATPLVLFALWLVLRYREHPSRKHL
ncbi:hypothetical protein [Roseimaritima sediminicola]|uniref:hypothetical protein n=1 Tax=Roseimaritima sediminicola TaxID=2662066 RepID=UPI001298482D|nr:hypothetical protein [Roseimaritima sediminicola]